MQGASGSGEENGVVTTGTIGRRNGHAQLAGIHDPGDQSSTSASSPLTSPTKLNGVKQRRKSTESSASLVVSAGTSGTIRRTLFKSPSTGNATSTGTDPAPSVVPRVKYVGAGASLPLERVEHASDSAPTSPARHWAAAHILPFLSPRLASVLPTYSTSSFARIEARIDKLELGHEATQQLLQDHAESRASGQQQLNDHKQVFEQNIKELELEARNQAFLCEQQAIAAIDKAAKVAIEQLIKKMQDCSGQIEEEASQRLKNFTSAVSEEKSALTSRSDRILQSINQGKLEFRKECSEQLEQFEANALVQKKSLTSDIEESVARAMVKATGLVEHLQSEKDAIFKSILEVEKRSIERGNTARKELGESISQAGRTAAEIVQSASSEYQVRQNQLDAVIAKSIEQLGVKKAALDKTILDATQLLATLPDPENIRTRLDKLVELLNALEERAAISSLINSPTWADSTNKGSSIETPTRSVGGGVRDAVFLKLCIGLLTLIAVVQLLATLMPTGDTAQPT